MKNYLLASCMLLFSFAVSAQSQYEILYDAGHNNKKILNGIINKYLIQNDTAYSWFAANQKGYNPDTSMLTVLEKNKNAVSFMIFGGTWCEDTQFILPKFFKLQEKSGIADDRVTLFGVNRQKETLGNIARAMKVTNVPTIIVMRDGKEIGRVVEYGKTGKWDKELTDLIR